MKTKIFAHRGASIIAAENTMPAFEAALKAKADGIELDVQKTKDQKIVVTHDENLRRVTLTDKTVAELDYAEIKKLNAAAFRQNDEKAYIPLLVEVLDLIKDQDLLLNIELKNAQVQYENLEEDTIALVKEYGMEERVIYSSFNHYSIMKLLRLGVRSEVAFLYMEGLFEPWKYAKNNHVHGLHPYFPNLMIPNYMDEARTANVKVRPWTVDQTEYMQQLITLGVDGLITNDPVKALEIRSQIQI